MIIFYSINISCTRTVKYTYVTTYSIYVFNKVNILIKFIKQILCNNILIQVPVVSKLKFIIYTWVIRKVMRLFLQKMHNI